IEVDGAADEHIAGSADLGGAGDQGLRLSVDAHDRGGRRGDGGGRAEGDVAAVKGGVVDVQGGGRVVGAGGRGDELDGSVGAEHHRAGVDENAVDVDEGGDDAQVHAVQDEVADDPDRDAGGVRDHGE